VKKNGMLVYRRKDKLVPETYHSRQALELRDPDSEDGWYLVELDNSKVLCLWDNLPSGPLGFDARNPSARRFPCTEFTVLRDRTNNLTAEVACAGEPINPVILKLPDRYDDWLYTYLPKDGEIVSGKSFDEVREEVQKEISS
jgi:hypothetical protein